MPQRQLRRLRLLQASRARSARPISTTSERRRQEARKRVLDDPRERERLKALTRQNLRAANSDLALELQLTDAEHDALIELLAENDMQTTAMTERDPSLGYPTNDYLALRDRLMRDIADLLGAEKAQQYAAYEDAWQVRNQVQQLRGELSPGDALTEAAEPSVARGPAEGTREFQRGHAATRSERATQSAAGVCGTAPSSLPTALPPCPCRSST